jgi:soluble lytic murein transglycosylase-like protein
MDNVTRNLLSFLMTIALLCTVMAATSHRDSFRKVLFPPEDTSHRESSGKIRFISDSEPAADSFLLETQTRAPAATPPQGVAPKIQKLVKAVADRFRVAPESAQEIVLAAHHTASAHQLPVTLILAVIEKESSFNPRAVNDRDFGLMQVNSKWHADRIKDVGGLSAMFNPATNIEVGTEILKGYIEQAGSLHGGLRRYNGMGKRNDYPTVVLRYMQRYESIAI